MKCKQNIEYGCGDSPFGGMWDDDDLANGMHSKVPEYNQNERKNDSETMRYRINIKKRNTDEHHRLSQWK